MTAFSRMVRTLIKLTKFMGGWVECTAELAKRMSQRSVAKLPKVFHHWLSRQMNGPLLCTVHEVFLKALLILLCVFYCSAITMTGAGLSPLLGTHFCTWRDEQIAHFKFLYAIAVVRAIFINAAVPYFFRLCVPRISHIWRGTHIWVKRSHITLICTQKSTYNISICARYLGVPILFQYVTSKNDP